MANPISPPSSSSSSSRSQSKRRKITYDPHGNHSQPLLPGLPDHLAQLCLSHVHPSFLYPVCWSWRRLIYSDSYRPFLSLYALLSSSNPQPNPKIHHQNYSDSIEFYNFDPISSHWHALPTPPAPDPPLRLLLRHPSFISRNLPVQSVSVAGNLVLLAATSGNFVPALPRPLVFNPLSQNWKFGPSLSTPRRWCAAGVLRDAVYVASGFGINFSTDVARSVERWDFNKRANTRNKSCGGGVDHLDWEWKKVSGLRDARFSRDAIDAVGWRGKLYMVNVKGATAKDGVVYDMENDIWEDMPDGMIAGWRGPVTAMDEEVMFVVDEIAGALRKYDQRRDCWEEIMESERLVGAQRIVAGGGRVCVVCASGVVIVVIDVMTSPPKLWVVDLPAGLEAEAIHILPRMTHPMEE